MVLENFRSHICFCRFLWIKFRKWSWVFANYNMWYICCIMLLGRQYNRKNYAESMPSVSTSSSYGSDVSSQPPTYENEVSSQVEEDSPYIDNRLQTGDSPYKNIRLSGNESTIEVKTSADDENDVVVIIKHNGKIVRNAYIQGGDSYQFSVPNGTYQVFFYGGKGWNPDKKMAGGYTGGFITNESFSKDNAVTLDYQGLNYELIPQRNGNFNTELSSETEMF